MSGHLYDRPMGGRYVQDMTGQDRGVTSCEGSEGGWVQEVHFIGLSDRSTHHVRHLKLTFVTQLDTFGLRGRVKFHGTESHPF